MRNYKLIFFMVSILCCSLNTVITYGQNGTYMCTSQAYTKADKSVDENYSAKTVITIEINDKLGGYISINNVSQDFNFRYDILSKDQTVADKSDRSITNTYTGRMSQFNIPVGDTLLIGIIQKMDSDSLGIWVYNDKFKAYNYYLGLTKL